MKHAASFCAPRRLAFNRRQLLGAPLAAAALASVGRFGQAQEAWPSRAISLVIPFPPGGVADTVGRPVAEALARSFGQAVVVENRAGAGGGVGMAHVARAKPDGYTLLMALSSVTIIPEADRILERAPMYQLEQLDPIARFTADPTALVVRADSPWKTLADFLEDARRRPGAITFGSSGNYGTMHVPMEMLKQASNTFMLHVPYTGAGPAIVGLMSNQVDALATGPSTVVQHIRSGRLRALAHWGEGRLASLPEIPSLAESGLKVQFSQWAALFAPSGLAPATRTRIADAAKAAATDERVVKTINGAGSPIQYLDGSALARFVQDDARLMADVVRRIGKQ